MYWNGMRCNGRECKVRQGNAMERNGRERNVLLAATVTYQCFGTYD